MALQGNGQFTPCCKNGLSCHTDWPACPPLMLPFADTINSRPSHSTTNPDFSILLIAILGILATAFLVISYYAIVAKCSFCTSWVSQQDPNTELSLTEPWDLNDDGLDASVIRSIPMFNYTEKERFIEGTECVICLNDFEEEEPLRLLPKCNHAFHLICVDSWLESHSNCPLCRANIMDPGVEYTQFIGNEILISSPDLQNNVNAEMANTNQSGSRNESTTLDVGTSISINIREQKDNEIDKTPTPVPKSLKHNRTVSDFAGNMQRSGVYQKKQLCEEPLQAMRRSFSMDSSSHRYCIDLHEDDLVVYGTSAGSSNMIKRSFLFFGNNRGRSNAILPL